MWISALQSSSSAPQRPRKHKWNFSLIFLDELRGEAVRGTPSTTTKHTPFENSKILQQPWFRAKFLVKDFFYNIWRKPPLFWYAGELNPNGCFKCLLAIMKNLKTDFG
jgi:hypothetical protein